MQIFFVIAGILVASCIIYYKFYPKPYVNYTPIKKQNPYLGLREQAISIKSEQLQLILSEDQEIAFGVIAELGIGNGSATIVSFMTGDASMYTSSGGGIIGGAVSHENVKSSAINLVNVAQRFFPKMPKSYNLNIPKDGYIKFYILTNKATYSFEGKESEITDPNSNWAELFNAANDVISQLRIGEKV